jgi:hypothetical protein
MANKTAVDFLAYELINLDIAYEMGLEKNEFHKLRQEIIKKAKEMEKQQIFDTWDNGFDNGNYYGKYNENCEINCGEQYYNETYKSE